MRLSTACLGSTDLYSLLSNMLGENSSLPSSYTCTKLVLPFLLFKREKLLTMNDSYGEISLPKSEYPVPENCLLITHTEPHSERIEAGSGFERVSDLELYAKNVCELDVEIYTSLQKRITMVVQANTGTRQTRDKNDAFIASFIPRLCPWIFKDKPLSDKEKEVLKAMSEHKESEVTSALTEFYSSSEFSDYCFEIETGAIIERLRSGRLNALRDEIENIYRSIREKAESLAQLRSRVHEREVLASDMMQGLVDYDGIKDALREVRGKIHVSMEYGTPIYTVRSDLVNFDFAEAVRKIKRSDYTMWSSSYRVTNTERALTKVFESNGKYRLQMCSVFDFDSDYPQVFRRNGFTPFMENRMANPHHINFHCLGSFEMDLADLSSAGDYYGLFMTMIESTGTVNVNEGVTMERFISSLYGAYPTTKCIRDTETDKLYTLEEIYNLEEEHKGENDQCDAH